MDHLSRRQVITSGGALSMSLLLPRAVFAQDPSNGLLARLRQAKSVKVGIANQPPFSSLNPDGTMTGIAPTIAQRVMERLGVPRMEGSVATYGELIPGMLAGRWDFVAASLTITKERCTQVRFSDPLSFEGNCIVAVPEKNALKPKTMADLIRANVSVGVPTGGAQYRQLLTAGMSPDNIQQFNTDPAMFDGLIAGRVQYLWASHLPAVEIARRRKAPFDIVFPVADSAAPGAANAFRVQDADLHGAYQKELRAMKASGEYLTIANQFGFEIPPELMNATADDQCKAVAGA
jgi:polar amino acid transport system substrate-binding protein